MNYFIVIHKFNMSEPNVTTYGFFNQAEAEEKFKSFCHQTPVINKELNMGDFSCTMEMVSIVPEFLPNNQ